MLLSACIQLKIACNKHVACSIFPVGLLEVIQTASTEADCYIHVMDFFLVAYIFFIVLASNQNLCLGYF